MPSQIAATPVLKGEDAKRLLEHLNRVPTEKSKAGEKKIRELFEKPHGSL